VRDIFISYVEEDTPIALAIVGRLERAGYSTWHYQRDSLPGLSHLIQTARAVEDSQAVVVVISPESIGSSQVTSEIVHAHEQRKPFIPILLHLTHGEFQRRQPEWAQALGASASIRIPPEGVSEILDRIVMGVAALGIRPAGTVASAKSADRTERHDGDGSAGPSTSAGTLQVQLGATFDTNAYPVDRDCLAKMLVQLQVHSRAGVNADVGLLLDASASMDAPDRYPLLRQAVRAFLQRVEHDDHVSIALFSTGVDVVLEPTPGAKAAARVEGILRRMDESPRLFGGATRLAPALEQALQIITDTSRGDAVRRIYVLTDGEIHDTEDCGRVLTCFPDQRVEVHVYGFGTEFDPIALRQLIGTQRGGSVKPICSEQDVVRTFEHIADMARRLVARDAVLSIEFGPDVVLGDAWAFRPQERYLGPVREGRIVRELGGLEAGRTYAVMVEVRLPPGLAAHTMIGEATLAWTQDSGQGRHAVLLEARRAPAGQPIAVEDRTVMAAYTLLDGLRRPSEAGMELAMLSARRELAIVENRDPRLLEAIDKQIAVLTGRTPSSALSQADERYLHAENSTRVLG
jgi:Mg-chelatase subunit ChlD